MAQGHPCCITSMLLTAGRDLAEETAPHLHVCPCASVAPRAEAPKTATLQNPRPAPSSKTPAITSSCPPKLSCHRKWRSVQTPPLWLAFKAALVKPNQRTALPMLRHHRDRAFGSLLPPKSMVASQTTWDKASDSSINPSEVKKGKKNHHKGPPLPFSAAPREAHSSFAPTHPRDLGHLLCLSFLSE